MSQYSRAQQQHGSYAEHDVPAGETVVPITQSAGGNRLRRSTSAENQLPPPPPHHDVDVTSKQTRTGDNRSSQLPPPAFVQNDQFFNEKITLPRLAVNEQEHITAEDYDNEDRGSLDNEEQSYDRTVRYNQSRSGSLPARRWQERSSSYLDWGTSPRSRYHLEDDAGRRGQHYEHHELTSAPWAESIEQKSALAAQQHQDQFSRQSVQQSHEREHKETHERHRDYHHYGSHANRRHASDGGGRGYSYEHYYNGGTVVPFYRPEHSSTLRRDTGAAASSSKHQRHAASSYRYGGYSSGGNQHLAHSQSFGRSSGYRAGGGYYKDRKYHKVNCCCFSFKWPPFAVVESEPPRPFYTRP
ncbi:hypothetical protein M3Y96_00964500 [Aphelenchoides besseyi]|nr:hypothetical protein M3Y96_00964500 [Aphelenchoides besseyi]